MKKLRLFWPLLLLAVGLSSCGGSKSNQSADNLWVKWGILSSDYNNQGNVRSAFTIVNKGDQALEKGWAIYFNFTRTILNDSANSITGNVKIAQVNGDLLRITPGDSFKLAPGDSVRIEFTNGDRLVNMTDAPAGLYIVFEKDGKEGTPEILSHYEVLPITLANAPTAASRYAEFASTSVLNADQLLPIIPAPVQYLYGQATVTVDAQYSINASADLSNEASFLEKSLGQLLGKPLTKTGQKKITLSVGQVKHNNQVLAAGSEAYQLQVKADGEIVITGTDAAGVFYGIQSLLALAPVEAWGKPSNGLAFKEITVTDYPRFPYRGMSLDVARNFQGKAAVLKLLDMMAFYKLNKFHFHLSDDEGWRVEIPGLPELTTVGAVRGHDASGKGMLPSFGSGPFGDPKTSFGSGHYTRAEFVEILKYAQARHIEVIPEVDMPGHIRAAIKAMDVRYEKWMKEGKEAEAKQYLLRDLNDSSVYKSVQGWNDNTVCPCQESTYNFVDKIITEFKGMYTEAGATMTTFHMGGDEVAGGVFEKSPLCAQMIGKTPGVTVAHDLYYYYVDRVNKIIAKHGLKTSGWEEIGLMQVAQVNADGTESKVHVPNPAQANTGMTLYYWNSVPGWGTEDHAYKLANSGYKVVMANVNYLYFDLAYNNDPEEIGYYWGGFNDVRKPFELIPLNYYRSTDTDRAGVAIDKNAVFSGKATLTPTGTKNIVGIQGNLWSENNKGPAVMEYMLHPRLIALAQRAWSAEPAWALEADDKKRIAGLESDWNVFANTMGQRDLKRMDYMFGGIGYRIPLPGAVVENGTLKANIAFPGMTIRYTTDGTEPTEKSAIYNAPVQVSSNNIRLKAFSTNGRSSRVSTVK